MNALYVTSIISILRTALVAWAYSHLFVIDRFYPILLMSIATISIFLAFCII